MNLNPYISRINTRIVKRKYVDDNTHLALANDITLDYEALNSFNEDIYVNNTLVDQRYSSSYGNIFVSKYRPENDQIHLSIDYDTRIMLLRSLTLRYLIFSILRKYMNLKVYGFATDRLNSSFRIDKVYFEYQAREIINFLERVIPIYVESGLEIVTKESENGPITKIPGIYFGKSLCPHLSNLSEIGKFEISHYSFGKNGITVYYNN